MQGLAAWISVLLVLLLRLLLLLPCVECFWLLAMGLAIKAALLAAYVLAVCSMSKGAVYKVGGSAGWTTAGHVDYRAWSSSKAFHIGDTIFFEYNEKFHNVLRVTHKNFNACNGTAPYFSLNSGNDSFTVKSAGHFYFICGLPGHCQAGQKVDIRVPRAFPSAPIPSPASAHRHPPPSPSSPSPRSASPSSGGQVLPAMAPAPSKSASSIPLPMVLLCSKLLPAMLLVLAVYDSGFGH